MYRIWAIGCGRLRGVKLYWTGIDGHEWAFNDASDTQCVEENARLYTFFDTVRVMDYIRGMYRTKGLTIELHREPA